MFNGSNLNCCEKWWSRLLFGNLFWKFCSSSWTGNDCHFPTTIFPYRQAKILLKKLLRCVGRRDENKNLVLSNELIKPNLRFFYTTQISHHSLISSFACIWLCIKWWTCCSWATRFDSFKYLLVIIEEMPTDTVDRTAKTFGVAIGKFKSP